MRIISSISFLLLLVFFSQTTSAQTLNEKLLSEDPKALVAAAREGGDIVRGAILFHQGNINCAKCHRAQSDGVRIGPNLGKLEADVTDTYLVEAILEPSKTIKKEYESVIISTLDGEIFTGIIQTQNDAQIILRDPAEADRVMTIDREDLDEMRIAKKSSMPDDLVKELKDRQQFLDLLRYVIDLKERGSKDELVATATQTTHELSVELSGINLINELNCAACHQPKAALSLTSPKQAPDLNWSAQHLNPDFLANFIANPHALKPGTTMPDLFQGKDKTNRMDDAVAITHFLTSRTNNDFTPAKTDAESVKRGDELFHSLGCVACHAPRDSTAQEKQLDQSIPLGELAVKYSLAGLVEFLENPHAVRPSGRMPNMSLTNRETLDIAAFLLQNAPASVNPWKTDSGLAKHGKQLFTDANCGACHQGILPDSTTPQLPSLAKVNVAKGCLSTASGNWPNYELSDSDRLAITSTITNPIKELSREQQISVSLKSFNCIACHRRDELGGVTQARNPHFKTTNLNLGDQGRIPPTLSGVGAKLNRNWMRDVLVNARSIRPYIKTRMPQYGESNIGHLIDLFQSEDKLPSMEFAKIDNQKEMRELGHRLAGNQGLNCVACHTYQYKQSDTMPAVDLTEMTDRLKKDWFFQYMLAPQSFSPNTVMPSFWPDGKAIRADIKGDSQFQIESLWQYLIDGRQARIPRGVVRERLEIVVTDEAKMLRRSYPGIGKRGIGVGYPGGVNLAFDAEQMRLAMIWKGKFLDPGGVWTGQGHGTARPMERAMNFGKGPDVDSVSLPWKVDDARPPNHQFLGYRLDETQSPTFLYRFGKIKVEDFFESITAQGASTILRRDTLFTSPTDDNNLSLKAATGKQIKDLGLGKYLIDNQVVVTILSGDQAEIIELGEEMQLKIKIELIAERPQNTVLEFEWK
ncbi:MAG: c-type cytochrome [Planctomycetaceae bacterium]|nr:c-type cytochrome [Planctomycetaceae bacterium]